MEIVEKRIHKIIARISAVADFRRIASDALRGDSDVTVSGLSGSGRALFIAGLWQSFRRPLIVVTPQDRGVEALATDLSYFHSELNSNAANRVCPFPAWETDPYAGVGRLWHINFGIIGMAYGKRAISRTKKFADETSLRVSLQKDMDTVGDTGKIKQLSWLAIPFLGASGTPVLILFADSFKFNFFAEDARIKAVVDMCWGFCQLIDGLEEKPFPRLRNFPLRPGDMVEGPPSVYSSVQEELAGWPLPKFQRLESFNYDAL